MPKYSAASAKCLRSAGYELRRLTLDERADKLVEFSDVMLRRKLNRDDAKCLLQNWARRMAPPNNGSCQNEQEEKCPATPRRKSAPRRRKP